MIRNPKEETGVLRTKFLENVALELRTKVMTRKKKSVSLAHGSNAWLL